MKQSSHRLMLIVNPVSGTSSKRGVVQLIEQRLREMGHEVDTQLTVCRGDATRLAKKAVAEGFDGVLACGGDGTVNETATALLGTDVALGILPAGSGNGLARHIGIPVDPIAALNVIRHDKITDCDYCTVNGRPFFCTFGVGFDAAVSHRFATQRRRGLMMYLKSAIDEFITYNPETYTLLAGEQEVTEQAFLIAACNASQYGNNAFIAPEASITDGLLDLTVIHKGNPISQALVGVDLLTGFIGKNALIDTIRVRHCTIIRNKPGIAHIDGEPVEMDARLDIECHPGELKIFVPGKRERFRPLLTPFRMFTRDIGVNITKIFSK